MDIYVLFFFKLIIFFISAMRGGLSKDVSVEDVKLQGKGYKIKDNQLSSSLKKIKLMVRCLRGMGYTRIFIKIYLSSIKVNHISLT